MAIDVRELALAQAFRQLQTIDGAMILRQINYRIEDISLPAIVQVDRGESVFNEETGLNNIETRMDVDILVRADDAEASTLSTDLNYWIAKVKLAIYSNPYLSGGAMQVRYDGLEDIQVLNGPANAAIGGTTVSFVIERQEGELDPYTLG